MRQHFPPTRMAVLKQPNKKGKITSVGENVKKSECSCTACGNVKWCSCYRENRLEVPQKVRHRITIWSSNSIPSYIPKRTESWDPDTCSPTFVEALFTVVRRWKQPKYQWTDEQINKMWYIHTMRYYSATKRNEILVHATTWMNLENIMLSERSQTQKDKSCMIPFIWST